MFFFFLNLGSQIKLKIKLIQFIKIFQTGQIVYGEPCRHFGAVNRLICGVYFKVFKLNEKN